jgi:phosphate-transporting ATPase
VLEVQGITRTGLEPASFVLGDGECVVVQGPSGAGKSLLLRAVADLDPNEGRVVLDGVERGAMTGPAWRRKVVYLSAEPGWWAETVAEHFPHWDGAMAERLKLSADKGAAPVARLSTGERQRLAVLRALAVRPRVLLLDEPTAALDGEVRDAVEALLTECREQGMAMLWVSHDPAQAERVADRRMWLEAGRLR